jgi:hypothetical protein
MQTYAIPNKIQAPLINSGLFLLFLTLAVVIHLHHEPWSDEYIAFNIVARSHSLAEMHRRLAYEIHPMLWYLELWFFSPLVNSSPHVLDLATLINVSIMLLLVVFLSPFSSAEKCLILCGYYLLYEYSAVSRSYTLVPPLFFSFSALCQRYNSMPSVPFYLCWGLICILLANIDLYSTFLIVPLSLAFALKYLRGATRLLPLVFSIAVMAVVIWTLRPPSDYAPVNGEHSVIIKILKAMTILGRSGFLLTIPWHCNWLNYAYSEWEIIMLMSMGIIVSMLQIKVLTSPKSVIAASFIIGFLGIFGILILTENEGQRHAGHLWIFWVSLLWMDYRKIFTSPGISRRYFYALAGIQAIAGLWIYAEDMWYPFSDSKEISDMILRSAGSRFIYASYPSFIGARFTAYSSENNPELIYGKFGDQGIWNRDFDNERNAFMIKRHVDLKTGNLKLLKILQERVNRDLPVLLKEAQVRCIPAFVITFMPLDSTKSSEPITEFFKSRDNVLTDEHLYAYQLKTDNKCKAAQ